MDGVIKRFSGFTGGRKGWLPPHTGAVVVSSLWEAAPFRQMDGETESLSSYPFLVRNLRPGGRPPNRGVREHAPIVLRVEAGAFCRYGDGGGGGQEMTY